MAEYKNLLAILKEARWEGKPIEAWIRGTGDNLFLALVVVERDHGRFVSRDTIASVPFEPGHEDEAACDVTRHLTLDGEPLAQLHPNDFNDPDLAR